MPKVLNPDSLAPKRPASDVQDYLARKYASLHLHPESNPAPNGIPPHPPENPPSPPTSEKQRAANRRNARHSTGPKTLEGKAASAANSRRHGLYGGSMLLSIEDDGDYNRILRDLQDFYRPADSEERYVVEMVAQQRHRLLRHAALETGYLDYQQRKQITNAAWLAAKGRPDPFFEKIIPLLENPETLIPDDLLNLLLGRCYEATLTNARSSLAELTRIENNHRRNLAYWESRLEQLLRDRQRHRATPASRTAPNSQPPSPSPVTQDPGPPAPSPTPPAATSPGHNRATQNAKSTTSSETPGNEPISSPRGETPHPNSAILRNGRPKRETRKRRQPEKPRGSSRWDLAFTRLSHRRPPRRGQPSEPPNPNRHTGVASIANTFCCRNSPEVSAAP